MAFTPVSGPSDFFKGGDGGGGGDIMSFLTAILGGGGGGKMSPLLKTILEPLLKIQERGFPAQQQSLTDAFRAAGAGALRSGAYGRAMPQLLGDQALARSALIGSTTSSMLGPLLSALMQMQKSTAGGGGTSGWENIPPSQGLQTPMTPSTPTAPSAPSNQPLNLDQLLQSLMSKAPISPTYPDTGGISGSYPGAPADPWAELISTDYGYLNPGQSYEEY